MLRQTQASLEQAYVLAFRRLFQLLTLDQVLLSFIITAAISLLLSLAIILHETFRKSELLIPRKILNSLSDQQIITGIGIQSLALAKMDSMIPYHFFIVWMLSLLSTATHSSALLALVGDFKRDWVLRWLRQGLMAVNLILSSVMGILVLLTVMKDLRPTLPIGCAFVADPATGGQDANRGLSTAGTIAVIAANAIVFALAVWYLHLHRMRAWLKFMQIGGLLLLFASGVGAAIRTIMISQAFGNPNVPLTGSSEGDWSFGQLVPLLLLILPLVSAVEIMRGDIKVPPPVVTEHVLLGDGSPERHKLRESFQPNPFFGRSGSRFST